MELYLDLLSPPCRAVFLFARATGIPFQFQLVDLSKGQQYSEEFGKVSMVRKVPVMKDGSFILTESIAIIQYLVQKHASLVSDHWYPCDLQLRAGVNEYLSWQYTAIRTQASKVFLLKVMFPIIMGCEVPQEKMSAAVDELKQSIDLLEQKFLQDKAFIMADRISVADVVAMVELMQPVCTGLDVFEGRPKLVAWRQRVKAELGPKLFDEAHEMLTKMNVSDLLQTLKNNGSIDLLRAKYQKMFN